MFLQLRPNIWLASEDEVNLKNIKKFEDSKINRIVVVSGGKVNIQVPEAAMTVFLCPLKDSNNPTHIKDLACHTPKYMVMNGDKVLIVSKKGIDQGAYVAARMICELENKTIYDVFMELQEQIPEFDMNKVYF